MRIKIAALTGLGLASLITGSALAHHAFTAQYDSEKPVALTGVVVKIEWLNPHAYFFIDVADEASGEVATWEAEMGSPVVLMRQGWTRDSMKIGDEVSVEGIRARNGSLSLNAQSVVLTSTGQRLFTRSREEERSVAAEPTR